MVTELFGQRQRILHLFRRGSAAYGRVAAMTVALAVTVDYHYWLGCAVSISNCITKDKRAWRGVGYAEDGLS